MTETKERYFVDEEDTFYTLEDLYIEWVYRGDLEKEEYNNNFWTWLEACQDYNNGTLHEIYKNKEFRH